jgi:hypothetical protein
MSAVEMDAILFLIVFLFGVAFGILGIACWASNWEDRRKSLKGAPPGNRIGGARWLNGVGRRDTRPSPSPERLDPRPGQGRGWPR